MSNTSGPPRDGQPRDTAYWAQYVSTLKVTRAPTGALNLNVEAFMTPQGHPASAWITFSAYEEAGETTAQIHVLMRANDPIYEAGFRLLGSGGEDGLWRHTLTSLAAYFGVKAPVQMQQSCIDPRLQWSEARNVWQNAAIRTMLYRMLTPARWMLGCLSRAASTKGEHNV